MPVSRSPPVRVEAIAVTPTRSRAAGVRRGRFARFAARDTPSEAHNAHPFHLITFRVWSRCPEGCPKRGGIERRWQVRGRANVTQRHPTQSASNAMVLARRHVLAIQGDRAASALSQADDSVVQPAERQCQLQRGRADSDARHRGGRAAPWAPRVCEGAHVSQRAPEHERLTTVLESSRRRADCRSCWPPTQIVTGDWNTPSDLRRPGHAAPRAGLADTLSDVLVSALTGPQRLRLRRHAHDLPRAPGTIDRGRRDHCGRRPAGSSTQSQRLSPRRQSLR